MGKEKSERRSHAADPPSAHGKPPGRYHHGDLRAALIATATELIDAEGVEALSLRACARRIGVSSAAVFRHFADARALLTACAADGFDLMARMVAEEQAEAGSDAVDRFRAVGVAYCRFALAHPHRFRLMFRHGPVDPADPAVRDAGERMEAALVAGIAPLLPRDDPPQRQAAKRVLAWAAAHGLSALLIDGGLDDRVPRAQRLDFVRQTLALMEPVFVAPPARPLRSARRPR
jgi:AcrR family transcriptional regulator